MTENRKRIYADLKIESTETSMYQVQKIDIANKNFIFAKEEWKNVTGTHYDRIYIDLLYHFESIGKIHPKDSVLVETTSGNAGSACANVSKILGYECIIILPEDTPTNRKKDIKYYGGTLIETKKEDYIKGSVRECKKLIVKNRKKLKKGSKDKELFFLNHSRNEISIKSMEDIGMEMVVFFNNIRVTPDYFITAIGNGTSTLGISRVLKQNFPKIKIIGLEPKEAPIAYRKKFPDKYKKISKESYIRKKHGLLGTGVWDIEFPFLNESIDLLDDIKLVSTDEWKYGFELLNNKEKKKVGRTSGACLSVSLEMAKEMKNKVFTHLFYDDSWKYESRKVNAEVDVFLGLKDVLSSYSLNFKKVFDDSCVTAAEILNADVCDLFLFNPEERRIELNAVAISGESSITAKKLTKKMREDFPLIFYYGKPTKNDTNITGQSIEKKSITIIDDLEVSNIKSIDTTKEYSECFSENIEVLKNLIVCPIWYNDTYIGSLRIMNYHQKISHNYLHLLHLLTEIISIAIVNYLYEKVALINKSSQTAIHELPSIIHGLRSYIKIAKNKVDLKNYENTIDKSLNEVTSLIGTVTRFVNNKPLITSFNAYKVILAIVGNIDLNIKVLFQSNEIEDYENINIFFDKEMFSQLMSLIIFNAEKVFKNINRKDKYIIIEFKKDSISFSSNTGGFKKHILEKDFVPFIINTFRNKKESSTSQGYGLIISNKICEINNCLMTLSNEGNKNEIAKVLIEDIEYQGKKDMLNENSL
ncbi:MAG TPA: pyridoxal-phosphate dependent enzyme [Arcobacter sp.]|nr:pyridoxal-phosphate dependent enzyme [Arcobacter sp.]